MNYFEIPYYQDYISKDFFNYLKKTSSPTLGIDRLTHTEDLGGLESKDSLIFLCQVYTKVKDHLNSTLEYRIKDRAFIDQRTKALYAYNQENNLDIKNKYYQTVLGQKDSEGRIVIGPHSENYMQAQGAKIAPLPEFLLGPHITLFGPPDNTKLCINAMNAYHRELPNEPQIIKEILKDNKLVPRWGADDEDSKTPLKKDLNEAGVNLTDCLNKKIQIPGNSKYQLASSHLAQPFKRFPGLALPCNFLFYNDSPLPLHLYDFCLHLFENWHNPEALVFYVPKLENEEEARYIKHMIEISESLIKDLHPEYKLGSVRLLIVLENPRAVFRTNEIINNLFPYFAGASLGWHDYLGSTARLFKEDGNYRIPVKADPDIVIKYIKASHELLADVVGTRGGIKIGGMYGTLPMSNDIESASFQVTMVGYIRDVITQMKRNLSGFWVAHPDFVRIGIAMVCAWEKYQNGNKKVLFDLIEALVPKKDFKNVIEFIEGNDIPSLERTDALYARALIAADIKESDFMKNNDPREIRYNVFQTLQYLADWLRGNGCVALPSHIGDVPVRVMDDLATCERSRWEVWHEIRHGRFSLEEFLKIAFEEMNFIRRDLSNETKIVQVKFDSETMKWYPIAFRLMIKLMCDKEPVEFAPELLLNFANARIRESENPLAEFEKIDHKLYSLDPYIERFIYFFERCGDLQFASKMASYPVCDLDAVKKEILSFTTEQIRNAASFHGDFGVAKKGLDELAIKEQENINENDLATQNELYTLCEDYREKFGFKFLMSAAGRSGSEILNELKKRYKNTSSEEVQNAKEALFEITKKRLLQDPPDQFIQNVEEIRKKFNIHSISLALQDKTDSIQQLCFNCTPQTYFQFASLSKSVASAMSIEYLKTLGIGLHDKVQDLLLKIKSEIKLCETYSDELNISHLMSHNALNMHYVNGFKLNETMPSAGEILKNAEKFGYEKIDILNPPGKIFKYSGGGFILLEYIINELSKKNTEEFSNDFLKKLNMKNFDFRYQAKSSNVYAKAYNDNGELYDQDFYQFPAFAAGATGTPNEMVKFLNELTHAYHNVRSEGPISHDTSVRMLNGKDQGSKDFMGCDMGIGIFTLEAGDNKFAVHQGANDGFRSLFVHCYEGPNIGLSFTGQLSGDNKAMLALAEICTEYLKVIKPEGVELSKFKADFDFQNISQEEIVNYGYKTLIFDAFMPTLPEETFRPNVLAPNAKHDLISKAKITKVSNQRFARAENLFSPLIPYFSPTLFGKQGKVMDSWETQRHNNKYDFLEFEFDSPQIINYFYISTKYHLGNQVKELSLKYFDGENWVTFIDHIKVKGHSHLKHKLPQAVTAQKFRLEVYPDGGITRLSLYTDVDNAMDFLASLEFKSHKDAIPMTAKPQQLIFQNNNCQQVKPNLASLDQGAIVTKASNEHYAPASQVLSPYIPLSMFDGFESARSHKNNHFEFIEIKLAALSQIDSVEIDFTYFINNNPEYISLSTKDGETILAKTEVKAYKGNIFFQKLTHPVKCQDLILKVYPDGGVNRLKLFGKKL